MADVSQANKPKEKTSLFSHFINYGNHALYESCCVEYSWCGKLWYL